uniref:Uncharacterized protein n=1 Tax=Panagrolaimus sp. ES5 TaxID=591445 RepID=A0AC34G5D2_9BILA
MKAYSSITSASKTLKSIHPLLPSVCYDLFTIVFLPSGLDTDNTADLTVTSKNSNEINTVIADYMKKMIEAGIGEKLVQSESVR